MVDGVLPEIERHQSGLVQPLGKVGLALFPRTPCGFVLLVPWLRPRGMCYPA